MADQQLSEQDLVDVAIDAGMDAIAAVLREGGARVKHIVVLLQAEGVGQGESDCVSAVQGFVEPDEALREIAAHALEYARAMGVEPGAIGPTATPG